MFRVIYVQVCGVCFCLMLSPHKITVFSQISPRLSMVYLHIQQTMARVDKPTTRNPTTTSAAPTFNPYRNNVRLLGVKYNVYACLCCVVCGSPCGEHHRVQLCRWRMAPSPVGRRLLFTYITIYWYYNYYINGLLAWSRFVCSNLASGCCHLYVTSINLLRTSKKTVYF